MCRILALVLVAILGLAGCSGGAGTAVDWRTAQLRDVTTGETFTIEGFRGKVVAIETMAIWCVTCRVQQQQSGRALELAGSADVVYISLDVERNEDEDDLAAYARREGFDWRFAVAPAAVSRALAAEFGDQVLSPPATPLVVLGPDGGVVAKHIGITSAETLAALFEEHAP